MMPNRILRDSIRTSKSLSLLSADVERLFYRLLVYADDQGRFDARPAIILGACFPLLMDRVTVADVLTWIQRLADDEIGILTLYQVEGSDRTYGAFRNWAQYQRMRNSNSKYPPPPQTAVTCGESPQTAASVRTRGDGIGDGIGDGNGAGYGAGATPTKTSGSWETSADTQEFWKVLATIPGWAEYGKSPSHCVDYLRRKGVGEERAEETAVQLKAKWGGKGWKWKDPWSTFQDWVARPPLPIATGAVRTSRVEPRRDWKDYPDKF